MIKVFMKLEENKDQFYPQTAKQIANHIHGSEPLQQENPCSPVLEEMRTLMDLLTVEKDSVRKNEDVQLLEVIEFIKDIRQKADDIQAVIQNIHHEKQENEEAVALLKRLKKENISLDDLQELKYITLRFGKIPYDQIQKIQYFQSEHFIIKELYRDQEDLWIVYCSLNQDLSEVDNVFSAIGFKQIDIPDFAHGKVDEAIQELTDEQRAMEDYIANYNLRIEKIKTDNQDMIIDYYQRLLYMNDLYDDCKYVIDLKDQAAIYVFSPFYKKVVTELLNIDDISIIELPVNIYGEKGVKEPVIVTNNHFVKPFEILTKFKAGDHFDPTTVLTIVIMLTAFGLLGDLGVGVILILLSVCLKGKISGLLQRLGLAILAGGLLTATIFYQMPIYQLSLLPKGLVDSHILIRFIFFIVINVVVYWVLMIMKNISRKKAVIKGGA